MQMTGKKHPPELCEAIFARYMLLQNYAQTGREFGLATQTVWDIVDRLSAEQGTTVAALRNARRCDMANKMWDRVDELISEVMPEQLGTEKASRGLEAARALGELGRLAYLMEPKTDAVVGTTEIHVHTGMKPPRELAGITDETTTTLEVKPS